MTEILCRWLNEEVQLSRSIDPLNFSQEFATGYLLGELMHKHGLQDDFSAFSQNVTSDSKLNNFTRLEPTLKLLEVPYDTNVARAIMNENYSATTRLMYQLFVALGKKTKMGLTGVAMGTMRPSGPVKLESIESGLYKERLKQLTKRQVDLNFENLVQRYQAKQRQQEELAFKAKFEEEESMKKYLQAQRARGLEKSHLAKQKQQQMMDKIREATVKIPKPPESKKSAKSRSEVRRQREAEDVKNSINSFEASMKAVIPPASPLPLQGGSRIPDGDVDDLDEFLGTKSPPKRPDPLSVIKPSANDDYINKIRTRLEEDAGARKEREKRRRRVLIEQMKAHEAQEEAHREEMLVNRLMRQSQQERRIAVQLMQIRHEKEVIRQNRIFREKQYAERRLKDFDDALSKEAELCRQAKIEYAEETRKAQELHDKITAERAQEKYNKHYNTCKQMLLQIVDFSCKVGEYRELTEKLIPPKMFREWTSLFISGLPLYEDQPVEFFDPEATKLKEIEQEKQNLMDEGDFMEYKNLIGEWSVADGPDALAPPKHNAVLGHIVQRLFNIVFPPQAPPPPPEFPPFPIKACFLGKFFSGKTSVIDKLVKSHRLVRLSVDDLVAEAIEAYKKGEMVEHADVEEEDEVLLKNVVSTEVANETPALNEQRESTEMDTVTPQSATQGKEKEDGNIQEERDLTENEDRSEKRDKTKEEIEAELTEKEERRTEPRSAKDTAHGSPKPKGPKLTVRAKLGAKAYGYLKKGKGTPEQLLVDIMIEAVRLVPEGTGWVMDNFPATSTQAKFLEKSLSGYDAQKEAKEAKSAKEPGRVGKSKKSRLAPDPHPLAETAAPKSGIDVVVLFDLPDEVALNRAEGRTYNPITLEQYHQQYNPPVEGSYSGINKQEKILPVIDKSNDREQVQQRITGFLESWPKLEKWFTKFGILQRVNADRTQDDLYEDVAALMNETYQRLLAPSDEQTSGVASVSSVQPTEAAQPGVQGSGEAPPGDGVSGVASPAPTSEGALPTPSGALSDAGAKSEIKSEKGAKTKAGSKPGSPKASKKGKKDRSPSPSASKKRAKSRSPSPPSSKKGSRSGSKSPSPSRKGSRPGSKGSRPGSKRGKSPKKVVEEVDEPPAEPAGPPEPEPGSEEWEYVDQPVDKEFSSVLTMQWGVIEETYIDSCKLVFHTIRDERELIHRYFYGARKYFAEFLKRPDEKQEYVLQWQKSYNKVAEDMRADDDTKTELHQQVDDLCDRLHDICDNRKELAEKERQAIMQEGWLEDRLGLLTNHYVTLMQAEVDRYQDTVKLLRDYYTGMEGKIPSERNTENARLPLVELPPTNRPQSASSKSGLSENTSNLGVAEKVEVKSPSGKREKDKDKGNTKTPEPTDGHEEEQKPRIPLVPRRPKSGDVGTGKGKDKKSDKKKDKQVDPDKPDTPVPPADPDEKLVFEAYIMALTIIDTLASLDQAEQEAEALRQAELDKEKEREALQKKTKDKKDKKGRKSPSKTSSPSKTDTPPPPFAENQEGQSEEEKLKQKIKERSRKEFLGAVAAEDTGLKTRVEVIKNHAIAVLQELKGKADSTYKDMDDWLGERFLQEVESIKQMSNTIRFAIEREVKLQDETLLEDKDFIVDLDTKTFKTPTPPPPSSPVELPQQGMFTLTQLLNLYGQFAQTAPSGVISNRAFTDTIMDMSALTYGTESLPDSWMNITQQQLQDVCATLSPGSEYIDWRRFLLAAAQPWPPASKLDLLLTLERCQEADCTGSGCLNEAEFSEVELWFKGHPELEKPQEPDVPPVFDRQGKLKDVFFKIFADYNVSPPAIDYISLLLYFSADSDPVEGFLRALSVSAGQPMPDSKSLDHCPNTVRHDSDVPYIQEPVSPPPEMNSSVTLNNLMMVLHHGKSKSGDTHRLTVDPGNTFSREHLTGAFIELGAEEHEQLPFHLLFQHPIIQDCIQMCQHYKAVDLRNIFKISVQESFE